MARFDASPVPPPMPSSFREILFWSSAICCLVAQALIVRSVLGVRSLPEPQAGIPRSRSSVELFWAVLPAVALGVLFFFTWRAIQPTRSSEQPSPAPTMEAAR
jgi:heme/copper-type cytochrome/quinol oxidase subunit 2